MGKIFEENKNDPIPVDLVGRCTECGSEKNKIQWGWHGAYYDLVCENDHIWTYVFSKQEEE